MILEQGYLCPGTIVSVKYKKVCDKIRLILQERRVEVIMIN